MKNWLIAAALVLSALAGMAQDALAAENGPRLTHRYGYDEVDRLSQIRILVDEGTPQERLIEQIDYSYDAKGQLIGKRTLNGHGTGLQDPPMSATYDAGNRIQTMTILLEGRQRHFRFVHDVNGNLAEKIDVDDPAETTRYGWDSSNRLVSLEQPNLKASYVYDALGRRIQMSVRRGELTGSVQYVYEGRQVLGEVRDGKLSHRLITGLSLDETVARLAVNPDGSVDAAQSRRFLTDMLNSVLAELKEDSGATVASSYAYSPYGNTVALGADAALNAIRYTSREADPGGLYFYRARYYDPTLGGGRFLSEDPTGLLDGLNVYAYVGNSPLSHVDSDGLARKKRPELRPERLVPIPTPGSSGRQASSGSIAPIPFPPPFSRAQERGKFCESPGLSMVWQELLPYRGSTRTNNMSGKDRRYYEWDHTHGDIEIYNQLGRHIGSMHPQTGVIHKAPVAGRKLDGF